MTETCYEAISKVDLEKMSTVQLIQFMRQLDIYNTYCDDPLCHRTKECRKVRQNLVMEIYELLKTRPHILNKIEAKKIRQQRAAKKIKTVSAR